MVVELPEALKWQQLVCSKFFLFLVCWNSNFGEKILRKNLNNSFLNSFEISTWTYLNSEFAIFNLQIFWASIFRHESEERALSTNTVRKRNHWDIVTNEGDFLVPLETTNITMIFGWFSGHNSATIQHFNIYPVTNAAENFPKQQKTELIPFSNPRFWMFCWSW